ncbi:hypothetical protein P3L51_35740, partial [Streptomyces sp. PSRA5]
TARAPRRSCPRVHQCASSATAATGAGTPVHRARGTIPRSYLRLTNDRSLPVAMQDRLIAETDELTPDNPYDVHSLAGSHTGFVLQAPKVAGILDGLAL